MQVTSTNVRELKKALRAKFPWIAMGATRICERIVIDAESELSESITSINMLDLEGRQTDHYDSWLIADLRDARCDDLAGHVVLEVKVYEGTIQDPSLWDTYAVIFSWTGRKFELHPAGILDDRDTAIALVNRTIFNI